MCAVEKTCDHCDQTYLDYGKEYDWEDYSYELAERFMRFGECCECGSTQVEQ